MKNLRIHIRDRGATIMIKGTVVRTPCIFDIAPSEEALYRLKMKAEGIEDFSIVRAVGKINHFIPSIEKKEVVEEKIDDVIEEIDNSDGFQKFVETMRTKDKDIKTGFITMDEILE